MSNIKTQRIYFLGGLKIPPGEETKHFIKTGQQVYSCPPVGGYLEIPEYEARDILSKYGTDVFTLNQRIAEDVAAGKIRFERGEVEGKTVVREIMSDEEVLARAAEIMAAREAEGESSEDNAQQSEEGDATKEEPEKKTRRRKKVEEA